MAANVIGKLVIEIKQDTETGDWSFELVPVMLTQHKRNYTRLALLAAGTMDYVKSAVGFTNQFVKNVDELPDFSMVHGVAKHDADSKKKADVDVLQQKLPLTCGRGRAMEDCGETAAGCRSCSEAEELPFKTKGTVTGRVTLDKPNSEEVPKDDGDS